MDFVTIFNKAIPPASQYFVTVKMGTGLLTSLEESNLELSSVGPLVVTKGMLRQLLPNSRLEANLMDRVMKLFQIRMNKICDCHKSVHEHQTGYNPLKQSVFLPLQFVEELQDNSKQVPEIIAKYFLAEHVDISKVNKIYFLSYAHDSDLVWALYCFDIESHAILYLDPRRNCTDPISFQLSNHLQQMKGFFVRFLDHLIPAHVGGWSCTLLNPYYYVAANNDHDSGLYVIATTYFLCNNVPVYFRSTSIDRLRISLAYWLLVADLPT